jgi:hypothetical protein
MGVLAHLGMGSANPVTEAYEFESESLNLAQPVIEFNGIRGSRERVIERTRQGLRHVGGNIVLYPTANELMNLMPRILGQAGASMGGYTQFTPSESMTSEAFYVAVDRVAAVGVYNGCIVNRATFESSRGAPLKLTLEIEALDETENTAGSFPALVIDASAPFVHMDSTLTLGGSQVQVETLQVVIDNMLNTERFMNSITRTNLPPTDRSVRVAFTVPWTSDTYPSLYNTGVSGVTADLKFSVGGAGDGAAGTDLHFLFGNIIFPANKSPSVASKDELTLHLAGDARKTGSTLEITVNVDNTP